MVSDMRVHITLCILGVALLCGAPVQAEAPPSGTPAEERSRPLHDLLERALSESAKDAGTSETAFRPRIELQYQHKDSRGPGVQEKGVLRIDRPLLDDRVQFRVDVPYQQFDPQKHKETTGTGAGDLVIRTATRLVERPGFSLLAGTDVIFPTGPVAAGGKGKYQVGPGVVAEVPIHEINSLIVPLVQHFQSVGGDPSKRDVNYTKFRPKVNTIWGEQWWTSFEPTWIVDWTRSNKTALNLEFEVGRKLGEHYRTWVKPGVGLWGDTVTNSYDWYLEAGVRYMF
jgi:hypothetical protein